jgi:hypothetical protein
MGEFHALAGVRRVIAYDNGSTDATLAILREPLGEADRAALAPALARRAHRLGDPQPGARLRPCRQRTSAAAFRWMAFIDVDEFLIPKRAATLDAALAHLGDAATCRCPGTCSAAAATCTRPRAASCATIPAAPPIR